MSSSRNSIHFAGGQLAAFQDASAHGPKRSRDFQVCRCLRADRVFRFQILLIKPAYGLLTITRAGSQFHRSLKVRRFIGCESDPQGFISILPRHLGHTSFSNTRDELLDHGLVRILAEPNPARIAGCAP